MRDSRTVECRFLTEWVAAAGVVVAVDENDDEWYFLSSVAYPCSSSSVDATSML